MTNLPETKNKFFEDLEYPVSWVPAKDHLITIGDFNAHVRSGSQTW